MSFAPTPRVSSHQANVWLHPLTPATEDISLSLGRAAPFAMDLRMLVLSLCMAVTACGGGNAKTQSTNPEIPQVVTPVVTQTPAITQQPTDVAVTAGQTANFTVVATGDAPLAYQWQRNGADVYGANGSGFTTATLAPADSGATFSVVVSDPAGRITSHIATLTVNAAASAPTLTVTAQPANATAVAGTTASFRVDATCSTGTLVVQWQRASNQGFSDIGGANATSLALTTALGDNGAQFQAVLSCSGQSTTTTSIATLVVSAPTTIALATLNITGTRTQGRIQNGFAIDQEAAGSYIFNTAYQVMRLSADLQTVTVVAGLEAGGAADGPATSGAAFRDPRGLAHDAQGNIWVTEALNHTVRRIAPDGTVTTVAGTFGVAGTADGTGSAARFNFPNGIAIGPDGDFYVTEFNSHRVRRVTQQGVVTTYAGTTTAGFGDGAPGTAQFSQPNGIAVAANGDVYVADSANAAIRKIVRNGAQAGNVVTLAGHGVNHTSGATPLDGPPGVAEIPQPNGLYLRGSQLYVMDSYGLLRVVDTNTGNVTTLSGSRSLGAGRANGAPETQARLQSGSIAGAPNGGLVLIDGSTLRTVDASGNAHIIASDAATHQASGQFEGGGALLSMPLDLSMVGFVAIGVDGQGRVVVSETRTTTVKHIDASGALTLIAGQTGLTGGGSGTQPVDGTGDAAIFNDNGRAMALAPSGVVYTSDMYGVRRIGTDNAVTLLAGSRSTAGGTNGTASAARFGHISGLAVGLTGEVFVGDFENCAIRRIDAAGNTSTFAGVIGSCGTADGTLATARFNAPSALTFAPDGTLYVSDGGQLRRIAPDGTVSTFAGVNNVFSIAVESNGTLYVMVSNASTIGLYRLDPTTGTTTLLVPGNLAGGVVLGNANPNLGGVTGAIAILAPKQIVAVVSGQLVVVTLP